ncbi:nucleoside phosphorylase [Herbivorax sp. ANBcel31]|uniref:5'-methylthioadenosine/S-adenosylhomocysteine nucleosidase family protein n=1 Tax=Herbivorax sp. ANBcel31 TaxID=3069754 RepID=UPI0027AF2F1D|nr:nucleoside phosphorylase [Herbivorax sp. ANBcel31]MDQ2084925.1 nucleoside phosphorylase [Herbivorax sp. ANBcel31]
MIFIVTALMIEAEPLIKHFKLKKDMNVHAFPVYKNCHIVLIISGIGKIKSAMATMHLLSIYKTTSKDVLLNVGFCGTGNTEYSLGTLIAANKITDMDTKKDYYPDVFINKNLPFTALCCYSKPVKDVKKDIFCDMESAGIMEAGQKFYYAHQVILLKIISDYLSPENLNKDKLKSFVKMNLPLIELIIQKAARLNNSFKGVSLDENEVTILNTVSQNLRFSKVMEKTLYKDMIKAKIKDIDIYNKINLFSKTTVNSKREGKKIFEEIRQKLK